jgi:hypothetical protein
MFATSDVTDGIDGRERPAGEIGYCLGGNDGLWAGRFVDRERVVAERFGLCIEVGDFSFDRGASVAQNDGAVVSKVDRFISGRIVFHAKSVVEFAANGSKNAAGHRGALSVALSVESAFWQ